MGMDIIPLAYVVSSSGGVSEDPTTPEVVKCS